MKLFILMLSMGNAKILIADDNNAIRNLVGQILEEAGFEVVMAADGREAVEKIYKENPTLCILDYEMPYKTGFEVVREIRSRTAYVNMPVIIFTADTARETKLKGLDLDIDDYLNKPADAEEIVARVRLLIRRSAQTLASNPLTRLPGTPSIQANIEGRINTDEKFAVLYCDLNNFKSYNDKYGFEAGDRVLKKTADIIVSASHQDKGSFVGHIGGDDFILVSSFDTAESIAKEIMAKIDECSPSFYNEQDRENKFMVSHDRRGLEQRFPLLAMGIGIVHNTKRPLTSFAMVSGIGAELKALAKQHDESFYVFDRREN